MPAAVSGCSSMVTGSESAIPTPIAFVLPVLMVIFADPLELLSNSSFGELCVL